jgi:hypothetical protein
VSNSTFAHWDHDRQKMVHTSRYTEVDATHGWDEYEIKQLGPDHFEVEATQWYSNHGQFRLVVTGVSKEVAVLAAHAASKIAAAEIDGDKPSS